MASLDVSHNEKLKHLDCAKCALEALNVSQNTELYFLYCNDNSIKELDLGTYTNRHLVHIDCAGNPLTQLNVSNSPEVQAIRCNKDLPVLGLGEGFEVVRQDAGESGYETDYYSRINVGIDLN